MEVFVCTCDLAGEKFGLGLYAWLAFSQKLKNDTERERESVCEPIFYGIWFLR